MSWGTGLSWASSQYLSTGVKQGIQLVELELGKCYVLVERSTRLELDGYDSVVWHVALGACASSTL